jgi:hypothetical protein
VAPGRLLAVGPRPCWNLRAGSASGAGPKGTGVSHTNASQCVLNRSAPVGRQSPMSKTRGRRRASLDHPGRQPASLSCCGTCSDFVVLTEVGAPTAKRGHRGLVIFLFPSWISIQRRSLQHRRPNRDESEFLERGVFPARYLQLLNAGTRRRAVVRPRQVQPSCTSTHCVKERKIRLTVYYFGRPSTGHTVCACLRRAKELA